MDTTLLKPPDHHNSWPDLALVMMAAAILVNLPLLVTTYRKTDRMNTMLSLYNPTEPRAIISHTITITARAMLLLIVLLLSAALLPTWPFVGLLAATTIVAAIFFHRRSLQIQGKPRHTPTAPLLHEANMETITVSAHAYPAGIMISDLKLRTITGASIIGIERGDLNIVNPEPDQDLREGDCILLLGTPSQLNAAKQLLLRTNMAG